VYVFGADNAAFVRSFIHQGFCVCVTRPGAEQKLEALKNDYALMKTGRVFIAPCSSDISSRHIRMKAQNKDFNNIDLANGIYAVRNDLDWATKDIFDITSDALLSACDEFFQGLFKSFSATFSDSLVKPIEISVNDQRAVLEKELTSKPVINMDCVTADLGISVNFSRMFDIADGQLASTRLVPRPQSQALESIPDGDYILADDDIATGFSMQQVIERLPDKVVVKENLSLLKSVLADKNQEDIYDVVDARDFLWGARQSGLVVRGPAGQIMRAPYSLPYVSLASRAKIPSAKEKELSITILRLNFIFYSSLGERVVLSDLDPSFQELMHMAGFLSDTPMLDVIQWHLDILKY
jgi:hypothetical protein